jgi:hypothetical protein
MFGCQFHIWLGPFYKRSHVEPKLNNLIGATNEINPKGFTLGVEANF